MPRSDSAPPASDAQMRELARQLADSAPPAPSWDDLAARVGHGAGSRPPTSVPRIALAFATVVGLLVVALWWGVRTIEDEEPADVPAPSTLPPLSAAQQWAAYLAATEPLQVQLCLARDISNRTARADLPVPAARADLAGFSDEKGERLWHDQSQRLFGVLVDAPGLDARIVGGLAEVVSAFEEVNASLGAGEGGGPAPELPALIDEFLRIRDGSEALEPEPDRCWVETPSGAATVDALAAEQGELVALRCLSALQLDHALAAATTPGRFAPVAEQLAQSGAITFGHWWFDSLPSEVSVMSGRVGREALLGGLRDPTTSASIRGELHRTLPSGSCPLLAATPVTDLDTDQGATP